MFTVEVGKDQGGEDIVTVTASTGVMVHVFESVEEPGKTVVQVDTTDDGTPEDDVRINLNDCTAFPDHFTG